jgi:hypothetical protein
LHEKENIAFTLNKTQEEYYKKETYCIDLTDHYFQQKTKRQKNSQGERKKTDGVPLGFQTSKEINSVLMSTIKTTRTYRRIE